MFDTHCHLQTDAFDEDREAIIEASRAAGVSHLLVPAIDHASFGPTRSILRNGIYGALGIHPHHASEWSAAVQEEIIEAVREDEQSAEESRIVAIGEIGIDYHYDFAPRELQRLVFSEQIELAKSVGKPIVIHTRESEDDVWEIVNEHYATEAPSVPRGQFHCFSAGVDLMQKAVSLGFYVSFTGNITFKKSTLADVVREVPLERTLIETDSPYMAPVPFRGKRNSPIHLRLVAEKIAEIKEIDVDTVLTHTFENALRLFKISSASLFIGLIFTCLLNLSPAQAQTRPAGSAPPDSILTGDRRKSEELRKQQEAELAREAAVRKQDSIANAQQEEAEALKKARDQARVDSVRAAEKIAADEREREHLLTPVAWKAIGIGGSLGIGNMPLILSKPSLTPTSVLASTIELSSFLTKRLNFDLAYTTMTVSDDFVGDSVYNYGAGTPTTFRYNKSHWQPGVHFITGEDLQITAISFNARYTITRPASAVQFDLGIGYTHLSIKNSQRYNSILADSITADPTAKTLSSAFTRGSLNLTFGVHHDFELSSQLTLTPFAEVSALGAFSGAQQDIAYVFQPDRDQIIMTHVRVGAILYFGWFGVPRL